MAVLGSAACSAESVWSEKTTPQPKVSPARLRSRTVTSCDGSLPLHQQREVEAGRAAADARDAHQPFTLGLDILGVKRKLPLPAACGLESAGSHAMSPVSTTSSRVIYDALKACGVRLMSALPETWLVHLIRMAEDDPEMTLVRLAKEEEGVGISAGRAPGRRQVGDADAEPRLSRVDQRHRLVRAAVPHPAADADQPSRRVRRARSVADRGRRRDGGDPARAAHSVRDCSSGPTTSPRRIAKAQTLAYSSNQPVALLLCRDLMWEDEDRVMRI